MYVCTNTVEEEEKEERVRENRQFHAYERGAHVAGKLETRILTGKLDLIFSAFLHYADHTLRGSVQGEEFSTRVAIYGSLDV